MSDVFEHPSIKITFWVSLTPLIQFHHRGGEALIIYYEGTEQKNDKT